MKVIIGARRREKVNTLCATILNICNTWKLDATIKCVISYNYGYLYIIVLLGTIWNMKWWHDDGISLFCKLYTSQYINLNKQQYVLKKLCYVFETTQVHSLLTLLIY